MTALSVAAAAAAAFNLTCTGTTETYAANSGKNSAPFVAHYRIDLTRKLWCADECVDRNSIAMIRPTVLILRDMKNSDAALGETTAMISIDRQTGKFQYTFTSTSRTGQPLVVNQTDGQCEVGKFTGFPAPPKTKF